MWTLYLWELSRLGDYLDGTVYATRGDLIDYCERNGAPAQVIDILQGLDEDQEYCDPRDVWEDMPDELDYGEYDN